MQDAQLLIEEWGTDIILLETALRQATPGRSGQQGSSERHRLTRQLRRARAAQGLLYELLPLLD
jgi:uncharacterized membrane protein YccC